MTSLTCVAAVFCLVVLIGTNVQAVIVLGSQVVGGVVSDGADGRCQTVTFGGKKEALIAGITVKIQGDGLDNFKGCLQMTRCNAASNGEFGCPMVSPHVITVCMDSDPETVTVRIKVKNTGNNCATIQGVAGAPVQQNKNWCFFDITLEFPTNCCCRSYLSRAQ